MSQNKTKLSSLELIKRQIASFRENQHGAVAITFALVTIPLVVLAGAALDYSRATSFKAKLQNIVDASALRALETAEDRWLSSTEAAIKTIDDEDPEVAVSGNADEVTVTATGSIKTSVLSLIRIDRIPVSVKARAQIVDRLPACILALNRSVSGAVSFSGAAGFFAEDCVVHSNSKDARGLDISNNSEPVAAGFCSAGGVSAPDGIKPNPRANCRTMPDPFAGLRTPFVDKCTGNGNSKKNSVGSNETAVLTPGTYCGGLNIQGNATLQPGVYVINDGELSVNAQAVLRGQGVTFYLTGSKSGFTINGGASVNLEAPTTGDYGGIVIFQDPLAKANGNKQIENTLNGGADTMINGAIYTPGQAIRINGSSGFGQNSRYMPVIADVVTVTGSSKIKVDIEGVQMAAPLPMSTETRIVE
jgi:hypothetical protein